MKYRSVKMVMLFAAGVLGMVMSPAVTANATEVRSGVAATLASVAEQAEENSKQETLNAGISAAMVDCILASEESAEIALAEAGTDAYGENGATCGYTRLGIAKVEGSLNVRKEAGEEAELVGKMPENAGCEILGTEGEWTQIQSGEVSGFVKSDYLLTGDEAENYAPQVMSTVATVTTETLYVRAEPNTECDVVAMMPMQEQLEVIENQGDWIKVSIDSEEGYVSAQYVTLANELPKAMTMTEVKYGQGVSDVRVDVISYATQFVGNPYVWGGTSLTNGADCSGFTMSIMAKYGVYLPHSSKAQANSGTRISTSELQPGDLIFYGSGRSINHVAIYIGNGQIVHASSRKTGIKISNAFYRTPICATRVLQ